MEKKQEVKKEEKKEVQEIKFNMNSFLKSEDFKQIQKKHKWELLLEELIKKGVKKEDLITLMKDKKLTTNQIKDTLILGNLKIDKKLVSYSSVDSLLRNVSIELGYKRT